MSHLSVEGPLSPDSGDDLTVPVGLLYADGLRHGVGHGAMVVGAYLGASIV